MKKIPRIIVIGTDHHNTLTVIRAFGREKCDMKILFVTNDGKLDKVKCAKSRYAKGRSEAIVADERTVVQWLQNNKCEERQIIFPCADFPAYVIDRHYTELNAFYVMPHIKDNPGEIAELMDKWNQWSFSVAHNIPMAKTWKITLPCDEINIPGDMSYPCIIKPEVSAMGNKSDISKAADKEELLSRLKTLTDKGYHDLIVQEYLGFEKESVACGFISNGTVVGTVFDKIREASNGSTAYGSTTQDERLLQASKDIVECLKTIGYDGLYDIELFSCKDNVYLNEINFRHSGVGSILVDYGINAPYLWCLGSINQDYKFDNIQIPVQMSVISELADLYNVSTHEISLSRWIHDVLFTKSHTVLSWHDLSGTIPFYLPYAHAITRKIKGKKIQK